MISKLLLSKNFWLITLLSIIIILLLNWYSNTSKLKEEKNRYQNNIVSLTEKLELSKSTNNENIFSKNALEVKYNELELINSNLAKDVESMNIKLKNIKAVTKVKVRTIYINKPDNIIVSKIKDSIFNVSFVDTSWINMEQQISIKDDTILNIVVDSLKITIRNELTIVDENVYKGWWFWRKVVSSKIHIKSTNPYVAIDKIYTLKIKNKRNNK